MVESVGHVILHGEAQRVLIDKHGVAQPVGDGVLLGVALDDEGAVGLEVEAADDGRQRVAITEIHVDALGILALGLEQVAPRLYLLEGRQHDVVGQVAQVGALEDAVDVQGIAPNGVLKDRHGGRRHIDVVRKRQHLALL